VLIAVIVAIVPAPRVLADTIPVMAADTAAIVYLVILVE
jgi:hypothetical protein